MTYEDELKNRLAELHEEYRLKAKPIIDELVRLENMKPPKPIIIPADQIPESLRSIVNRLADESVSH